MWLRECVCVCMCECSGCKLTCFLAKWAHAWHNQTCMHHTLYGEWLLNQNMRLSITNNLFSLLALLLLISLFSWLALLLLISLFSLLFITTPCTVVGCHLLCLGSCLARGVVLQFFVQTHHRLLSAFWHFYNQCLFNSFRPFFLCLPCSC